jgi:hypothetical protein
VLREDRETGLAKRAAWTLRVKPDTYLASYPNGPHAPLARTIIAEWVEAYRQQFDDALTPALAAFHVLVEQLGEALHEDEEMYATLHQVCREWLRRCLPHMNNAILSVAFEKFEQREASVCRQVVRRYSMRLSGYGALGPPRNIPTHPQFWRLKEDPKRYLRSRWEGGNGNAQNLHLARAALAPFEAAMWKELRQVERALSTALMDLDSGVAHTVYQHAVRKAQWVIADVRYNDRQSQEHYWKVKDWLDNLALGRMPEGYS